MEFLFWAAWRKGEALGLRWADVNRAAGVIRIETTKTGEPRTLPYSALPVLRDLIERRWKLTEASQRKREKIITHVFHRDGTPIRYFRRSWITACREAGVPGRIVHDLRRSAARNMVRAGVPQSLAMAIGGWKTDSVFRRLRDCR